MANKITDEELEELNKKLQENTTPKINESSYEAMLENLGKEEGYDYLADYDVLKNSRLAQSYSPRTNKVYTYEEAQALTPKQYWEDVMGAANHTDKGTSKEELAKSIGTSTIASAFLGPLATPFVSDSLVKALNTNTGKTLVWGINEGTGGTALYKAIKGEEAVQNKLNQIERVYGDNQIARTTGNVIGNLASYTLGSAAGGLPGAAIAGGISGAGQAYTYSDNAVDIAKGAGLGAASSLIRYGATQGIKNAITNIAPSLIAQPVTETSGLKLNIPGIVATNAVSSGGGAYASSALTGTLGNIIDTAQGKDVDWKKPFWSAETLTNVALSSIVGGIVGTKSDIDRIQKTIKYDTQVKSAEAAAKATAIEKALYGKDLESAKALAKSELDSIEKFADSSHAGVRFDETFKGQMIDDWTNYLKNVFQKYGYNFDYPTSSGTGTTTWANNISMLNEGKPLPPNFTSPSNNVPPTIPINVGLNNQSTSKVEQIDTLNYAKQQVKSELAKINISKEDIKNIEERTKDSMQYATFADKINYINPDTIPDNNIIPGNSKDIQIRILLEDIKENGFEDPIVISDENGLVSYGAHRLLIAQALGLNEIPIMYSSDLSPGDLDNTRWYDTLEEGVKKYGSEYGFFDQSNEGMQPERRYDSGGGKIGNNSKTERTNVQLYQETQENSIGFNGARAHGDSNNSKGKVENSNKGSSFLPNPKIANSMSMEEAKAMLTKAYNLEYPTGMNEMYYDERSAPDAPKSMEEWLAKTETKDVANAITSRASIDYMFPNKSDVLRQNPQALVDVIEHYKNNALKGKLPARKTKEINRARESSDLGHYEFEEKPYAPKFQKNDATNLLRTINDKSTSKKAKDRAKGEFIVNAHNEDWLKENGISLEEAYNYMKEWADYGGAAERLSQYLNQGVAEENRWTGIENSSSINRDSFDKDDLLTMIRGTSGKLSDTDIQYTIRAILAIDTHQGFETLKIISQLIRPRGTTLDTMAEYMPDTNDLYLYDNGPNTEAHEIGHYLDSRWYADVFEANYNRGKNDLIPDEFLTNYFPDEEIEAAGLTENAINFVKHFYDFLDDITTNADLSNEYTHELPEVFARFTAKFIEWTSKLANSDFFDPQTDFYKDKFTQKQMENFVKLLQEKSVVDGELKELDFTAYNRAKEIINSSTNSKEDFKELIGKAYNKEGNLFNNMLKELKTPHNQFEEELSSTLVDTPANRRAVNSMELALKNYDAGRGPLDSEHNLLIGAGEKAINTFNNPTSILGNIVPHQISFAKKSNANKNLTIEKQNKDIERLEKANQELRDKLAKEKEKNKQKLQATKEEGKEKLSRLTSKKNEEKVQAVKEVKTSAAETLKKQKTKDQAILKEAKLDAKATTTKKRFGRANTKLEKALTNVYDKPQSKELDTALEALKKATRGTTKLINKVRTQIPSSMSVVIDDINEILDTYYTGANKMTDEKRASLIKKAEAIEKYAKEHPTVPISKQALDVIKQSTQKSLSDLNPKDLVDLAENVQTIGMDLRDSMSFTRASEDAVKLREEAINFVKGEIAKGGKRTDVPTGKVANTSVEFMRGYHDFNSNITRLITNLSGGNPNSPLYFMDDRLREGTVKYFEFQEKLLSFFEKMVEVQRVPGLGKRVVNKLDYVTNPKNKLKTIVKTSKGENHSLTIADGISIVLGRKDLQFAGHTTGVVTGKLDKDGKPIVSEGGYVILANQADAINGNINKGLRRGVRVKLTNEIVDKLQAELENIPAAKELMDIYSNSGFLKENARIVNDAYEAITGMSIDERENYFRTVVNPNDRRRSQSQDPTKSADLSAKDVLLNTSIVKPVVEGANNSIYIYPIGDVINKMIDDSSIYGAFATELYDIETFLNAADKDGVSLRELIGNLDPDFLTELGQIEDAIIHRRRNTVGANILEKTKNLVGNYSGSILHGNAFLALKQIGSLPTAAPFFQTPTQSILNGMFNKSGIEKMVREHFERIGEDVSGLSDKEVFDKFFKEATTELETRKRGYTKPTKAEIFKYASPLKRIEAFDWYKSTDNWTVNNLAYAMVYDYLTNFGEEINHEELVRELGSQFIKMHYATQPNTAPYTRTLGQLSDNPLARAALYMADPRLKQANTTFIARQHYKWSKENGTEAEKRKYGKAFAEAIVGALSGMAYIVALNEAKSKLKNKDKNKTAKDVLTDVIANTLSIYAIGFDMIINRIISKDYDFDVSVPDTEVINKLNEMYKHGSNFIKHTANGEDNYKYKDIKNIISDLSYITGVPVKNLQDDFMYFLSAIDSPLYYEMKIKEDANMYKKYLQFEDRIDDYKEFYTLYKATRESVVKEKYGTYNNKNIKKAIQDVDGDVSVYYKVFKLGK